MSNINRAWITDVDCVIAFLCVLCFFFSIPINVYIILLIQRYDDDDDTNVYLQIKSLFLYIMLLLSSPAFFLLSYYHP